MGIWFLVGWEAPILLLERSVTTNQSLLEKSWQVQGCLLNGEEHLSVRLSQELLTEMLVSLYVQEGHPNQETVPKARPHILPGTEGGCVVTRGSISEANVSQTQGQCGAE